MNHHQNISEAQSAADVDLAQGANNSPGQKDYITSRAWERSHVNQTVRIFNVSFITPSRFSIALFLLFSPPTSYPTPSSNSYRSELAGSRLSSIVGVSSATLFSGSQRHKFLTNIHLCFNFFFLPSFSSGNIPRCSWQGFPQTVRSDGISFIFSTDFHQPKWLRMSASGTHYVNMGLLKKRWNSCGTWLVGQCGKAAPACDSWKNTDVRAAVHKEVFIFYILLNSFLQSGFRRKLVKSLKKKKLFMWDDEKSF